MRVRTVSTSAAVKLVRRETTWFRCEDLFVTRVNCAICPVPDLPPRKFENFLDLSTAGPGNCKGCALPQDSDRRGGERGNSLPPGREHAPVQIQDGRVRVILRLEGYPKVPPPARIERHAGEDRDQLSWAIIHVISVHGHV